MSGWWRTPGLSGRVGTALADLLRPARPTVVIAPANGGLMLGPLVAEALGVGFLPATRADPAAEIAEPVLRAVTAPDYRGRRVELLVRRRHLHAEDRVALVDDWIDSGAQLAALQALVADAGVAYVGAAVIVDGAGNGIRSALALRALLRRADLETRIPSM